MVPGLAEAPGPLERLITMKTAECEGVEPAGELLACATLARVESVEPIANSHNVKAFVDAGMAERRKEIGAVNQIITDELSRFVEVSAQREVAPLVASMRQRAEELRTAELERFRVRLSGLDDRQREAVEAVTRGVLAKLLHEPTVQLKEAAGTARGEQLAEATRILFDL